MCGGYKRSCEKKVVSFQKKVQGVCSYLIMNSKRHILETVRYIM